MPNTAPPNLSLTNLHADVDARVNNIRSEHVDWPCRSGCDTCCRRLAEIPGLTPPEWALLQECLAKLPMDQLKEISQHMTTLAEQSARPIICPLLDRNKGACRVYLYRPVACRTYGFYVQRDLGLYCKDIEARVAEGEWSEVIWGNQDAIDYSLRELGETRELTHWFADWYATV